MIEDKQLLSSFEAKGETEIEFLNSLQELWAKEKKEGDPELKFSFVFGHHLSPGDLNKVKVKIKEADVFIPEGFGWDQQSLDTWRQLSGGVLSAEKLEKSHEKAYSDFKTDRKFFFLREMIKVLERAGKKITFIDTEINNPLVIVQNLLNTTSVREFSQIKDFEGKKENVKQRLQNLSVISHGRENYMLQQLPVKIRELLDANPDLRKKPEVKILFFLGANHTPVYHTMKKLAPEDTEEDFSTYPLIFSFYDEAARRIRFNKQASLSEELLARVVLELDFWNYLSRGVNEILKQSNSNELTTKVRSIIELFSLEEIKNIYENIAKRKKFRDILLEKCKQKGIDMKGF
ncbi:MAG: hypothetical protein WCT44_00290 [Candidatus Paceibacterota bacterium]